MQEPHDFCTLIGYGADGVEVLASQATRPQAAAYKLQVTGYKVQATSYKSQATSYKLQVQVTSTSYKLQATSYTLQVTSYKLQVTQQVWKTERVSLIKEYKDDRDPLPPPLVLAHRGPNLSARDRGPDYAELAACNL